MYEAHFWNQHKVFINFQIGLFEGNNSDTTCWIFHFFLEKYSFRKKRFIIRTHFCVILSRIFFNNPNQSPHLMTPNPVLNPGFTSPIFRTNVGVEPRVKPEVWRPEMWPLLEVPHWTDLWCTANALTFCYSSAYMVVLSLLETFCPPSYLRGENKKKP
jgi:hypothetical protein